MGHRAQERAYRPKEAWGSHPTPRHQLYAGAAMNQRYKEARRAVSKGVDTEKPHFSVPCSHVRVQGVGTQLSGSAAAEEVGSEMRTAGDRTSRRRLNKLSCAGWLPHDRSFVSGLPRSKDERRSGDRLITGQEDSPPRSCRRQCVPADLLLSTSLCCCRRVWWLW
jgi:hypothetical protein